MASPAKKTTTPGKVREALVIRIDDRLSTIRDGQSAPRFGVDQCAVRKLVTDKELRQIAVENHIQIDRLTRWVEGDDAALDLKDIQRIAESQADTEIRVDPNASTFVLIPTAQKIFDALDVAVIGPAMVHVCGAAGVGKTMAIAAYAAAHSNTVTVTASAAHKTAIQVLVRLADKLGRRGEARRTDSLVDSITSVCHSRGVSLIVVDEAQHLRDDTFEVFRGFHDDGGIGIAYAGNKETLDRIGGRMGVRLAQISSRIRHRVDIPHPDPGDVDVLLDAHRLGGKALRDYAQAVALTDYGLRGLLQLIVAAKAAAAVENAEVTADHFRAAARIHGILQGVAA